jgi:hypothetical protein
VDELGGRVRLHFTYQWHARRFRMCCCLTGFEVVEQGSRGASFPYCFDRACSVRCQRER